MYDNYCVMHVFTHSEMKAVDAVEGQDQEGTKVLNGCG